MSSFGLPPVSSSLATQYSRVDLQAAFNWLVNQPDHIRKQASDPDRLMTLYYRSTGKPHSDVQAPRQEFPRNENLRMENEAPVSSQNFLSDLRQINEALRQFEGPQAPVFAQHSTSPTNAPVHSAVHTAAQAAMPGPLPPAATVPSSPQANFSHTPHVTTQTQSGAPFGLNARTLETLQEVRMKLNLSSDAEALQMLVSLGYKQLKPLIG